MTDADTATISNNSRRCTVDHTYVDHMSAPYDVNSESLKKNRVKRKHGFFPRTLHRILMNGNDVIEISSDGEDAGCKHHVALWTIISWSNHGRSFIVYNYELFQKYVLPKYYNTRVYSTFQRQLNMYDFKRLSRGRDKGAYYHERFLRGREDLVWRIQRKILKGVYGKPIPNPEAEPHFYVMHPLPIDGEATRGDVDNAADQRYFVHNARNKRATNPSSDTYSTQMNFYSSVATGQSYGMPVHHSYSARPLPLTGPVPASVPIPVFSPFPIPSCFDRLHPYNLQAPKYKYLPNNHSYSSRVAVHYGVTPRTISPPRSIPSISRDVMVNVPMNTAMNVSALSVMRGVAAGLDIDDEVSVITHEDTGCMFNHDDYILDARSSLSNPDDTSVIEDIHVSDFVSRNALDTDDNSNIMAISDWLKECDDCDA